VELGILLHGREAITSWRPAHPSTGRGLPTHPTGRQSASSQTRRRASRGGSPRPWSVRPLRRRKIPSPVRETVSTISQGGVGGLRRAKGAALPWKLDLIRSGVTDLGKTMTPLAACHEIKT
jgi:hypothetical protein